MKFRMMGSKKVILTLLILLISLCCLTQPVSADTTSLNELKQCYEYLQQKKDAYLPHEILASLSLNALQQLKQFVLKNSAVSQEYNTGLIDAFIKAEETKLLDSECYVEQLNGCWQLGTATIADGYNNRFVFLASDKSFVFYNSFAGVKQKDYSKSGFFFVLDSCCIELHVLTQWTINKGKKKAKDVNWYETLRVGHIKKIDDDDVIYYLVKIGNAIYWRYSNNPNECNVE
jgi:hypothetical protein